jgi:hypothetical protein
MNRKAYIINFAKGGMLDNFDYKKFHDSLTTAKGVINWWHYLEPTYIIIVENNITATNVADFVRQLMPQKYLLIAELNLRNHDGWLPKEAWDWINKYTN